MNRETLNSAFAGIRNFSDKLGETFYDAFNDDDNNCTLMARGIIGTFSRCITKSEFEIANDMLIGICGYSFESLVEQINEQDQDPEFEYESCEK